VDTVEEIGNNDGNIEQSSMRVDNIILSDCGTQTISDLFKTTPCQAAPRL